jgi:hypothetical protein
MKDRKPGLSFSQKLKIFDRAGIILSFIALVSGGLWTIFTYIDAQSLASRRDFAERKKQLFLETERVHFTLFEDKKKIYEELVTAASSLAAADSYAQVLERKGRFLELFAGRAHLLPALDNLVNERKVEFWRVLDDYVKHGRANDPFTALITASQNLASACAQYLTYVPLKDDTVLSS